MSNNQFSALLNDNNTCQHIRTKVFFELLLGIDMFTLTFVDLEYETSFSIWEF